MSEVSGEKGVKAVVEPDWDLVVRHNHRIMQALDRSTDNLPGILAVLTAELAILNAKVERAQIELDAIFRGTK